MIRLHVPPLRQRREEIPHLSSFFLREACDELAKPDVELSSAVLDLFAQHMWPGNVRQLRNEIRRAVAMSVPGTAVTPDLLSPELARLDTSRQRQAVIGRARASATTLSAAVDQLERDLIRDALEPIRRQHLRDGAPARADPARPLSQTAPTGLRSARRSGYKVISQWVDWILYIQT